MGEGHQRKSHRLSGYDYTLSNAYFVTMVTKDRECLFGRVFGDSMELNELGEIVLQEWLRTPEIRAEIGLDEFVIMPNHLHGIIHLRDVGAHGGAPLRTPSTGVAFRAPRSLGSFIAGFKSAATKRINILRHAPGVPVWQPNFYDRIIRDEDELNRIRQYIIDNPAEWAGDPENPLDEASR
jgi:REP element-mobilizing transposase RayT